MTAFEVIDKYIAFFEKKSHKKIVNSPLVSQNDPTTLFTSSGMQPLIPYLLGEEHPQGKRLVNVQNCFRAADIEEVGDNRHTVFFRMLGNWSLGDYFKREQLPWFFEFLTSELKILPENLYVTVFAGYKDIPKDEQAEKIWQDIFRGIGLNPAERIFYYGADKNWWSRSGEPGNMPTGEPGGPDSEVFYKFNIPHDKGFGKTCHPNCQCGAFTEIGNSVFMQYQKQADGSLSELPQKNVDFGGGLERLISAIENKQDVFETNLFLPIVRSVEKSTDGYYQQNAREIRIITDHFIAGTFMIANSVFPSNKEQGYILRRLLRRGFDNFEKLGGKNISPILESIIDQYKETDPYLVEFFEKIKFVILQEKDSYKNTLRRAKQFIAKKYGAGLDQNFPGNLSGDELKGVKNISANDAFILYSTHGLSPSQIKSLGYFFDEQEFAKKMQQHQNLSRQGAEQKFKGGLADHREQTVRGHTATHLLHQALRDILEDKVHQTGSNITTERVRFDFAFARKLTSDEIKKIEQTVNEKIKANLPVVYKILPLEKARELGAIGLFGEKYQDAVKVYFVGGKRADLSDAYSKEFCGGPHVDFTGDIKSFKIIKEEGMGKGNRRIYAKVA